MKKNLLRKLYILMLAVAPMAASGTIYADAAEITFEATVSEDVNLPEKEDAEELPEETILPENEEEAELPEETILPENEEEAEPPEETILPENVEEAEPPEETILPENEEEAELPQETILPESEEEAELPEETILPENAEEAELPEETILPENEEEAELPEETILPENEEEAELPEETILPENAEEAELPEETILPENAEEAEIPEETILPENAEETRLPERGLAAEKAGTVPYEKTDSSREKDSDPAEAETGIAAQAKIAGEEKLISHAGAAELLKSGVKVQMVDRIHYITLKDKNAASDSILIESNGHYGLVDASHPSWDPDPRISGYTVDVDDVIKYLHTVGVMHLDFVLGTHSHSDHIGGMKFLASALNAVGNYWIDSKTVYYYKQQHYNQLEEGEWEWQNSRMFRQSIEAMQARGAIMVETGAHKADALKKAKAVFVKGGSDPVSDSIEFTIGNLALSLFNLYHNSSENENLNSIVTAVRKGERVTLLMGDLEMENGYERRVANAVAAKYGNADVIKLAHHGYDECTGSDTLRTLKPSYVVTTSNRTGSFYDDEPPFNYFLAHRGITAYRAAENSPALVEDLTGDGIRFLTYNRKGNLTGKPVEWKARMTSGWKKWNRDDGTYDYIFIREDGSAATGWNWLTRNGKTSWYLFDRDGVSLRGFQKSGQDTYYLNKKGEMQTDWQYVGGKWYYMDGSGAMKTGWQYLGGIWYYMDGRGAMQTGWQKVGGIWYYMDGSGAMKTGWQYLGGKWYYMDGSGAMKTGWQYLDGIWYYMDGSGAMQTGWQYVGDTWYYMDGSGAMQTGWQYLDGIWYYMDGNGAMKTGWQYLGGKWYYMDGSGAMQTGWIKSGGNLYLLDSDGAWTGT